MKKDLTQKQKKFIYIYIKNGGNAVQAALSAYDTKNYQSATRIAGDNLKNPRIWRVIEDELKDKGITVEKIALVLADGLEAKMVAYSPETKEYNVSDIPNHNIRHKFVELTLDVIGARK